MNTETHPDEMCDCCNKDIDACDCECCERCGEKGLKGTMTQRHAILDTGDRETLYFCGCTQRNRQPFFYTFGPASRH